jgi:hypothetical protein
MALAVASARTATERRMLIMPTYKLEGKQNEVD